MGVYIKGMEMPKEGAVIVIDSAGQVWSNEWPTRGYTRLDGVTAVPVPPHGRLIDADEIVKHDHQHYEYLSDTYYVTVRDIELAPTIIPADPPKEET